MESWISYHRDIREIKTSQILHVLQYIVLYTNYLYDICMTFVQRRPNDFDVDPTFYKCYSICLCLQGEELMQFIYS